MMLEHRHLACHSISHVPIVPLWVDALQVIVVVGHRGRHGSQGSWQTALWVDSDHCPRPRQQRRQLSRGKTVHFRRHVYQAKSRPRPSLLVAAPSTTRFCQSQLGVLRVGSGYTK